MNLQLHLLTRITIVAFACLLATAGYALYHSRQQAEQAKQSMADSLAKQLEMQLLRINSGLGQTNPFPDFELWKQTATQPGVCIAFTPVAGTKARSLCTGINPPAIGWPRGFETLYSRLFQPGAEAVRAVTSNGQFSGSLSVTPSAEMEIAAAWAKITGLMTLSIVTILAVCLLVYLSISRALRPAKAIVAGLENLADGHLAYRLPWFELNEWQTIATAINQLAASQQELIAERQKLTIKLMNLQEAERRDLCRELHDEFGQCLTGINAIAASIRYTAVQKCPELIDEADHIGRITGQMLKNVRDLLGRLRPAEFDELGLAASLNSLVASWNRGGEGMPSYQLNINGDCSLLPEPQAVSLFRVTQECLTNIAKHAKASKVDICLNISREAAVLIVKDNGIARSLPFAHTAGIGLLGIRERVEAQQGRLTLAIAEPHGLMVEIYLPIPALAESKS